MGFRSKIIVYDEEEEIGKTENIIAVMELHFITIKI